MDNTELLKIVCSLVNDKKEMTEGSAVELPYMVGEKYYFRTVTYHCTGMVKKIIGKTIVLEDAAWIADSGRFRQAIMDGILDEVEPVDVEMYLNSDSITDAFQWKHKLPREQK